MELGMWDLHTKRSCDHSRSIAHNNTMAHNVLPRRAISPRHREVVSPRTRATELGNIFWKETVTLPQTGVMLEDKNSDLCPSAHCFARASLSNTANQRFKRTLRWFIRRCLPATHRFQTLHDEPIWLSSV